MKKYLLFCLVLSACGAYAMQEAMLQEIGRQEVEARAFIIGLLAKGDAEVEGPTEEEKRKLQDWLAKEERQYGAMRAQIVLPHRIISKKSSSSSSSSSDQRKYSQDDCP